MSTLTNFWDLKFLDYPVTMLRFTFIVPAFVDLYKQATRQPPVI